MNYKQSNFCRGCLGVLNVTRSHSLTDSRILNLFKDCTNLTVSPEETDLPRRICAQCYTKCIQWRAFWTTCHEVDKHLRDKRSSSPKPQPEAAKPVQETPMEITFQEDESTTFQEEEHSWDTSFQESCRKAARDRRLRENIRPIASDESDDDEFPESAASVKKRTQYKYTYNRFQQWRRERDIDPAQPPTEDELMTYFKTKVESQQLTPSSVVSQRSMLRKEILKDHPSLDINRFYSLSLFCKNITKNYQAPKTPVFSEKQLLQFLNEAPDETLLLHKAMVILGSIKSLRSKIDLHALRRKSVVYDQSVHKIFIHGLDEVTGEITTVANTRKCKYVDIILRYMDYANRSPDRERFFVHFVRTAAFPVGNNRARILVHKVAEFLKLPNPEQYNWKSVPLDQLR